jgi:hypothetical protein
MSFPRWQQLTAPQRVATLAGAAAVAVWTAVLVVPTAPEESVAPTQSEPEPEPAQAPAQTAPAQADAPKATRANPPAGPQPHAAKAPAQDPLGALRDGLSSENSGQRIAAVRKLAKEHTTEALPELLARDVAQDPELAPTLIQVSAQLAQRADASQRTAAVAQLSRWLHTESSRDVNAARGNVSVLVEALAGMNSPDAESALIDVLRNQDLPLHVQTLAVEGLARLATPDAMQALQAFRTELGTVERQGFEQELQHEAQQLTDRALARLSH